MKSLKYIVFSGALVMGMAAAQAGTLCHASLYQSGANVQSDVLTESHYGDNRAKFETNLGGYDVSVIELISKDQSNPTLSLAVKSIDGFLLQTVLPSPGVKSGEAYVRTQVSLPGGALVVKCIAQ